MSRLIYADALKEHLSSYTGMFTDELGFAVSLESVLNGIDFQPTIEAEPVKHGRWIMRGGKLYCSECQGKAGVARDSEDFWYTKGTACCPNCGAKMDLEVDDERGVL